jgi:hypothetical protein
MRQSEDNLAKSTTICERSRQLSGNPAKSTTFFGSAQPVD